MSWTLGQRRRLEAVGFAYNSATGSFDKTTSTGEYQNVKPSGTKYFLEFISPEQEYDECEYADFNRLIISLKGEN